MTAAETDAMITKMKAQGYRLKDIAAAVQLTSSGVHRALERIAEGRPGHAPRA